MLAAALLKAKSQVSHGSLHSFPFPFDVSFSALNSNSVHQDHRPGVSEMT